MLPQKLPLDLLETQWAQQLNPILSNPLNKASILKNVSLVAGSNTVDHKLGAKLQGWYFSRVRAATTVYDTQDLNQTPQLTLTLVASAPAVVDIVVFA